MEENEKRDINMVAMEVIMNAGDGRDKIDEALAAMAEGKLDEVDKLLEEAEALIVKAHNAQTEVIQSQVSGESMEYSLRPCAGYGHDHHHRAAHDPETAAHRQDAAEQERRLNHGKDIPGRIPLGRLHSRQPDRRRMERGRPRSGYFRLRPSDHQTDP